MSRRSLFASLAAMDQIIALMIKDQGWDIVKEPR